MTQQQRHQVNLNRDQYELLNVVRNSMADDIDPTPKLGNVIAFLCEEHRRNKGKR